MAFRAFIAAEVGGLSTLPPLLAEVERLPADLKVVRAANAHVTLAFLGDLAAEKVPAVRAALAEACRGEAPFVARVRGLGAFPPKGAPRVVWAGMEGADALARIAARLAPRLSALGLPVESRAFTAHVTLARSRSPRGAEAVRRFVEDGRARDLGETAVREVVLMESRLSPQGPTYLPVAHVPLGGAA